MVKIGFVTCVQLGLSCIEEIYKIGGKLDLLITLKDEQAKDKSGRIYLDDIAKKHNVDLLKVKNINNNIAIETIKKHELDWLFIIGWSQIAKKDVLNTPKKGCIGMHPTLLPEGRGRAAIPWAIIKKLDKTGVTMFKLDEGVDTGDIILQGEIPLHPSITATELYSKVNEMHVELIRRSWNDIVLDKLKLIPQDNSKATEWLGRTPSDGEIFPTMTMDEAETLVRATTHPYPGAFYIKKDKKTIVWSAEKNQHSGDLKLSDGYLIIKEKTIENV